MSAAVLTVDAMRAAEGAAMAQGVSEWELMRRAGEGAAQWVWRVAAGRPVTILCGPGNNGGDGYVVAEWLRKREIRVAVIAPKPPAGATAARARAFYQGEVVRDGPASGGAVMVDALFGYGLSRALGKPFLPLLERHHAGHGNRIALDVPSGVHSDTGEWLGSPRGYDMTIALGAWKRAHFLMPAAVDMGMLRLVEIGLSTGSDSVLSQRPQIAAPRADSHKYRRGLIAVVAGAMPGAALLAARAAMRSGAGYVKLLSDHSHPAAPADLVIDGRPLAEALADERIATVLAGPGLGRGTRARDALAQIARCRHRLVLDADALHLLDPEMLARIEPARLAVTPHEGELAQLCDKFGIPAGSKLGRIAKLRDATAMHVLAKGPDTVLAPAHGGLRFFPRGSSWLSVAGSGDVLAGLAAGRAAVTGDLATALEQSVWLHHAAARIAGPGFTAGRLALAVRQALALFA